MATRKKKVLETPERSNSPDAPIAPAPTKPTTTNKQVTPAQDLRVVATDSFTVIYLYAGVARVLPPSWVSEAKRCAAEQNIELTVE
jgi:hypothetical protein